MSTPTEDRPPIDHDVHTAELPPLPQRASMIPANRWVEAPDAIRRLGAGIGVDLVCYIRGIHGYLLWRAGRAAGEPARYCAVRADDLDERWFFALDADGTGRGVGPDGVEHTRFRSWKESLRDAGVDRAGPGGSSGESH
ncbi:MAG: hypothetical protein MUE36_15465 [Acidimicrobiales bacterium]|jgi:hypothetical protein|nr:hypothetical protein [Acidimicrobiales bacterium]